MSALACPAGPARADGSSLRVYDADQGLTSLGGACLLQDRAGSILVCSDHGVFAYDGRRFVNLGPDQGLRQGGFIYGLALTSNGRIAVAFADQVLVSDRAADASHPATSLTFHPIVGSDIKASSGKRHQLAPWRNGLALLMGDATAWIDVPDAGSLHASAMGYSAAEKVLLKSAVALFSVGEDLWEALSDGRLCIANPGAVRCYGAADGLNGGPWRDVVADDGGRVVARSAGSVATLDSVSGRWASEILPGQGDDYANLLGLFKAPDGSLVTPTDHGIATRHAGRWEVKTVTDGAPAGQITSAITDATGEFWLQAFGRGLVRWVGYGRWEAVDVAGSLSNGIPWMLSRLPSGALWAATDAGTVEIVRRGQSLQVGRVLPGQGFSLAAGPRGRLWRSFGTHGIRILDPADGSTAALDTPPVDVMVPDGDGLVWVGTEGGLFEVHDTAGAALRAVEAGSPRMPVSDIARDGAGGVFYLSGDRLRHHRPDGSDVSVAGLWPDRGFQPLAMAFGHDGTLWAGGGGGLFRFTLSGDRVTSSRLVPTSDTQTNTVNAVMVDHRGWVWAGTALGLSVFDGWRWVSLDTESGLISNDVNQGGLREDPDGSVWISTGRGLSHLLDPGWIFADHPIQAVVSAARLGAAHVSDATMPYTRAPLSVQFSTPNYGAERSVTFRYRLSGVDAGWAESASGLVSYPFVPPGRHVLTVVAHDRLTHGTSLPASLTVDVAFPWWWQPWSVALWVSGAAALAAALMYGVAQLYARASLAREAELRRRVAEATALLRHQAEHDSLTGLLNRSEVERRLAGRLARGAAAADETILALIDVDHFKRINDTHGHLGGDDVLRALGRLLSRAVRDDELAGRYGGEEILLALDDSDGRGAERVLDLHRAVRHDTFMAAGTAIHVTCSIGLAWAVPGDTWESLVGRADDALYEAKQGGRNRVVESSRTGSATARAARHGASPTAG